MFRCHIVGDINILRNIVNPLFSFILKNGANAGDRPHLAKAFSPRLVPVSSSGLLKAEGQAECQHANAPPRQVPGRVVIVHRIAPRLPSQRCGQCRHHQGGLAPFRRLSGRRNRRFSPASLQCRHCPEACAPAALATVRPMPPPPEGFHATTLEGILDARNARHQSGVKILCLAPARSQPKIRQHYGQSEILSNPAKRQLALPHITKRGKVFRTRKRRGISCFN